MRQWIVVSVFLLGCSSDGIAPYQPVDWNSKPVPSTTIPKENVQEVPATLQALLKLHNQERGMKGRPALQLDLYLCDYAQQHAEWMAKNNNLQHSKIADLLGQYDTVGENIAWNQKSEQEVVTAWMNSSGHRANILNRAFGRVGFGVAYTANGQPYWCACFGN